MRKTDNNGLKVVTENENDNDKVIRMKEHWKKARSTTKGCPTEDLYSNSRQPNNYGYFF